MSRAAARRSCSRSTASAGTALGIDFGHSHVRVAVSDLSSAILAERVAPIDTDHAAHEGLDVAMDLIGELLAEASIEHSRVIGAGLGLPTGSGCSDCRRARSSSSRVPYCCSP